MCSSPDFVLLVDAELALDGGCGEPDPAPHTAAAFRSRSTAAPMASPGYTDLLVTGIVGHGSIIGSSARASQALVPIGRTAARRGGGQGAFQRMERVIAGGEPAATGSLLRRAGAA